MIIGYSRCGDATATLCAHMCVQTCFAFCNRLLQHAVVLQLDLAKLMCYTIKAVRKKGSDYRGKFATGSPDSDSSLTEARTMVIRWQAYGRKDTRYLGTALRRFPRFFWPRRVLP
jgi:NAD-dependent dihydropyrimidine dehydrogenase PreA subunit